MSILLLIVGFWYAPTLLARIEDPFFKASNTVQNPPTKTTVIELHYVKAETMLPLLKRSQLGLISSSGKIAVNSRLNALIIIDTLSATQKIRSLVRKLDIPETQTIIEAQIVMVDKNYLQELGAAFKSVQGEALSKIVTDGVSIPLFKLQPGNTVNLELQALEKQGHATLISKPTLMTLNHEPATIESGQEIPYQESTSSGATSVTFKKAVLRLEVTPTILPHRKLLLDIKINQDNVSALTVNGVPAIRTQKLNTRVILHNKQTLVLGGILETTLSSQTSGVPMLRKLPILGALFRRTKKVNDTKELLVFITPKILP